MLILEAATDTFRIERYFLVGRCDAFKSEHGARPFKATVFRQAFGGSKRHGVQWKREDRGWKVEVLSQWQQRLLCQHQ